MIVLLEVGVEAFALLVLIISLNIDEVVFEGFLFGLAARSFFCFNIGSDLVQLLLLRTSNSEYFLSNASTCNHNNYVYFK